MMSSNHIIVSYKLPNDAYFGRITPPVLTETGVWYADKSVILLVTAKLSKIADQALEHSHTLVTLLTLITSVTLLFNRV
jgi:hypothetical protein